MPPRLDLSAAAALTVFLPLVVALVVQYLTPDAAQRLAQSSIAMRSALFREPIYSADAMRHQRAVTPAFWLNEQQYRQLARLGDQERAQQLLPPDPHHILPHRRYLLPYRLQDPTAFRLQLRRTLGTGHLRDDMPIGHLRVAGAFVYEAVNNMLARLLAQPTRFIQLRTFETHMLPAPPVGDALQIHHAATLRVMRVVLEPGRWTAPEPLIHFARHLGRTLPHLIGLHNLTLVATHAPNSTEQRRTLRFDVMSTLMQTWSREQEFMRMVSQLLSLHLFGAVFSEHAFQRLLLWMPHLRTLALYHTHITSSTMLAPHLEQSLLRLHELELFYLSGWHVRLLHLLLQAVDQGDTVELRRLVVTLWLGDSVEQLHDMWDLLLLLAEGLPSLHIELQLQQTSSGAPTQVEASTIDNLRRAARLERRLNTSLDIVVVVLVGCTGEPHLQLPLAFWDQLRW
jgi:hypothetical protein